MRVIDDSAPLKVYVSVGVDKTYAVECEICLRRLGLRSPELTEAQRMAEGHLEAAHPDLAHPLAYAG